MRTGTLQSIAKKPAVVVGGLVVVAVLALLGVNRLVVRYREQEKALARRMYRLGQEQSSTARPEEAIASFRAALSYDRGNFQYQLSLARALRDAGHLGEAEAYLSGLWERAPQDSPVNLALARLEARMGNLDEAIRYYHNAMYGVWPSNPDFSRRNAQLELIEFLLGRNAIPQAQAELISLLPSLPPDPDIILQVAELLVKAEDDERAYAEFRRVLQADRENPKAVAGAGEAAFRLGRYGTASNYLQNAVRKDPQNAEAARLLETTKLVLQSDPYAHRLPVRERNRRIQHAFERAGARLTDCAKTEGIDLSLRPATTDLGKLETGWQEMKTKVLRMTGSEPATGDAAMDIVFQIEQQTQRSCGAPQGIDEALALLSQQRLGAER